MVNINDLVLLEKEDEAKKALIMAISNKFQLYIIDRDKSCPRALTSGELDEIRSAIPRAVDITLWRYSSGINPFKRVSYLDLWMDQIKYEEFFSKKINVPSEAARTYSTPHLELMYKAIEEFWINADLTYPPKKDIIVQWLESQGAPNRIAIAIDTIIRPEQCNKGGNKRS